MTSSRAKRTAAIGVLKAAASAAEAPTGTRASTLSRFSPNARPITDAIPDPIMTDGPSRPSATPLAKEPAESQNFARTVRRVILPPWTVRATFVWGMPLPLASGKNL